MKNKELRKALVGRVVMVHPELTTDPGNMRGAIGKVAQEIDDHSVTVSFDNHESWCYSNDALITLMPAKDIIAFLNTSINNTSIKQLQLALDTLRSMMEGRADIALKNAMINPDMAKLCITDLQNWIDLKKERLLIKAQQKGKKI